MDETTLETLEYPQVIECLKGYAVTGPGASMAGALMPLDGLASIESAFGEFGEGYALVKLSGRLPLAGLTDIGGLLEKAAAEGAYLLPEEFSAIRDNIEVSASLLSLLSEAFLRSYPILTSIIRALSDQKALRSELARIFDEKGEIRDNASPELNRIRREIRGRRERARSILEKLSEEKKLKEMLQEDFITIRDDRYVLAIKAATHSAIDGIIHGRSGSGATYFMEPLELVELNNRVALLKKEERAEEIAILKAATALAAAGKADLTADSDVAARLDLIQAKALFALDLKAVAPSVKREGGVKLINARHPLLALKALKGGAQATPIDIIIPEDCSTLVISGANTGGKTVALKTLGLLTLMAEAGMPVTADEGSVAVAFPSIFSDIGDRQDIIASLSTFSAHIKRMKEFLGDASKGSLVLIDEIGAGTDPAEGGAFALAALETFREKGAVTAVTTHLNILKAHAAVTESCLNASVEFDEASLRPLYRLKYGAPGPSLGLSIAESLGIPHEVIARARLNIREDEGAFIRSVKRLEDLAQEAERLKARLKEAETRRKEAVERLTKKREEIIDRSRKKAEEALSKAREEMREAVRKFSSGALKGGAKEASALIDAAGERVLKSGPREAEYVPSEGDKVSIAGSNTRGTVLSVDLDGKKAELMVGSLKVWTPFDRLIKRSGPGNRHSAPSRAKKAGTEESAEAATSLNIIGMRVEEALPLVVRFLDNAHSAGLPAVEIIHGVGTGALSKAVSGVLSGNPVIKSFYHGDQARGGAGVTIAELK